MQVEGALLQSFSWLHVSRCYDLVGSRCVAALLMMPDYVDHGMLWLPELAARVN
jgi:hypothetical protein